MTGVATCGRELCCSSWLDKFSNISIRMAKEQDLPLNQTKLTGVCGRLKCCLIYELETYQEVNGKLPKVGETFHIPACVSGSCGTSGCATTQGTNVVKEAVVVELATGGRAMFTAQELGVTFDAVPAHTRGVGTYGSDEVPRQERPTVVTARAIAIASPGRAGSNAGQSVSDASDTKSHSRAPRPYERHPQRLHRAAWTQGRSRARAGPARADHAA